MPTPDRATEHTSVLQEWVAMDGTQYFMVPKSEYERLRAQVAELKQQMQGMFDMLACDKHPYPLSYVQFMELGGGECSMCLRADLEHTRQIVAAAVDYWRAYFNPEIDKCPTPLSSGPHDDHRCVVSLQATMHVAIGDYVARLDAAVPAEEKS